MMKRVTDNSEGPEERFVSSIRWKTTLLTAHVETASGPSLHMLRASIDDGSTYEVEARGELETNHAGSMVFITGDELVFALDTPIEPACDVVEEPASSATSPAEYLNPDPLWSRILPPDMPLPPEISMCPPFLPSGATPEADPAQREQPPPSHSLLPTVISA